jgi:catechol 1,2-dioxygenase
MIIRDEQQLTEAVLAETERTADPRMRQILQSLIRHLHGFAREVRLTEKEFSQAINLVSALGQLTTESHNETRLIAGSLGLSTLVCLMNNGNSGQRETSANLLGPFWRAGAPRMRNGASIVRSPTPGAPMFFGGRILDERGSPVAAAQIDVWQASPKGLYENQDPTQAEWNLRGTFESDAGGRFWFRSVKPAGYPVPTSGPTGALLAVQNRHPFRPAHLHCLIYKPGFKTMTSQIYSHDDPQLATDAQFGVTRALIGHYVLHAAGEPAPDADVGEAWYSLEHTFVLEPGEAWLPTPPVSAKRRAPLAEPAHG